jgi:hypothetical protein
MNILQQIHTVPVFAFNEDCDVKEFIKEVETRSVLYKWTQRQQFLIAKKRLSGTAELWLRAEPKPFTNWEDLKWALLDEFSDGDYIKVSEIHELDDILTTIHWMYDAQPSAQVSTVIEETKEVELEEAKIVTVQIDMTLSSIENEKNTQNYEDDYDDGKLRQMHAISDYYETTGKSETSLLQLPSGEDKHDERYHPTLGDDQTKQKKGAKWLNKLLSTSSIFRMEEGEPQFRESCGRDRFGPIGKALGEISCYCYDCCVFLCFSKFKFYLYGVLLSS